MILMDTHIWLRWILPNEPLPENHVKLINNVGGQACVIVVIERGKL